MSVYDVKCYYLQNKRWHQRFDNTAAPIGHLKPYKYLTPSSNKSFKIKSVVIAANNLSNFQKIYERYEIVCEIQNEHNDNYYYYKARGKNSYLIQIYLIQYPSGIFLMISYGRYGGDY